MTHCLPFICPWPRRIDRGNETHGCFSREFKRCNVHGCCQVSPHFLLGLLVWHRHKLVLSVSRGNRCPSSPTLFITYGPDYFNVDVVQLSRDVNTVLKPPAAVKRCWSWRSKKNKKRGGEVRDSLRIGLSFWQHRHWGISSSEPSSVCNIPQWECRRMEMMIEFPAHWLGNVSKTEFSELIGSKFFFVFDF